MTSSPPGNGAAPRSDAAAPGDGGATPEADLLPTEAAARKAALRREMRTRRRSLAPGQRKAAAAAIAEAALALWSGRQGGGGCVAAYRAMDSEPPTDLLIARALDAGVRVIVPELLADGDLDWRPVEPGGSLGLLVGLRLGPLLGREAIASAGLIVVPALSVDLHGTRLGQGGGSYDRALARRSPTATVVAVLNDHELVQEPLPREPHDAPVHAVITASRGVVELPC